MVLTVYDAFFVTVFESLRFHQSFLSAVLVWMTGEIATKSLRFRTKAHCCGRGLQDMMKDYCSYARY